MLKVERKKALVLLVMEIKSQLNEVAFLKSQGRKASVSMELLREMCAVLPELSAELSMFYFDLLLRLFGKGSSLHRYSVSEDYSEAIAQRKRSFIEQLHSELAVNE